MESLVLPNTTGRHLVRNLGKKGFEVGEIIDEQPSPTRPILGIVGCQGCRQCLNVESHNYRLALDKEYYRKIMGAAMIACCFHDFHVLEHFIHRDAEKCPHGLN